MGPHEMNGSLTSPGVYPGLISPQMSAAAAAAYGRSPIVIIFYVCMKFVTLCLILDFLFNSSYLLIVFEKVCLVPSCVCVCVHDDCTETVLLFYFWCLLSIPNAEKPASKAFFLGVLYRVCLWLVKLCMHLSNIMFFHSAHVEQSWQFDVIYLG